MLPRLLPIFVLGIVAFVLVTLGHALFTGAKRNWSRGSWIAVIFAILVAAILAYSAFQGT